MLSPPLSHLGDTPKPKALRHGAGVLESRLARKGLGEVKGGRATDQATGRGLASV
tara:strand:+ start:352 stop:516 length:165 start_codon:yes stop_codon:yes gene_type:complete